MEPTAPGPSRTFPCWACGAQAWLAADLARFGIFECGSCGLAFQPHQRVIPVELYGRDYFQEYCKGEHYFKSDKERRLEASVRLALVRRYASEGRLLEIGAASGHFLVAARDSGFAVLGVEANSEMAAAARERFSVEVMAGAIEEVDLDDVEFEVICGWHVLEHLPLPARTLKRLTSRLRPGGTVLFEVPNYASVRARRERAVWRPLDPAHHVAHYTPAALTALMQRSGLQTVEIITVPWAVYKRRLRGLLSYGKQGLLLGSASFWPNPWKHELLRVVARRLD